MNKLFEDALKAEGVTGQLAQIARSIYMQESSGGKNTKTSNAGAVGGMQIIPSTFKAVADKDWNIDDPMHNARAGIRYIKDLTRFSGGDPTLTAVGYYGGPGAIAKAKKGVAVSDPRNPNAPNTLEYGRKVASRVGGVVPELPAPTPVASTPKANPTQVVTAAPAPVAVASAPTPTPAPVQEQAPVQDAWSTFLENFRGSQAESQQQAANQPQGQSPLFQMPQLVVPDFLGTVAATQARKPQLSAFSGLGSWGPR